jgi:hypothetical protein
MRPTDESQSQQRSYRIYPGEVTWPVHDDVRKYNARAVNHRFSSSRITAVSGKSCADAVQRTVKKARIKFSFSKLLLLLFLDFWEGSINGSSHSVRAA